MALIRTSRNIRHSRHNIKALLRQSVYSQLAGYEDVNVHPHARVDDDIKGKHLTQYGYKPLASPSDRVLYAAAK